MSFLSIILISAVVGVVGTGAGGLIVSLRGNPSKKLLSLFLGYSGGVMVSLVAFDLMPEALELGGTFLPLAFMVIGAITIMIVDMLLPHSHHFSCDEESRRFARTAYVIAMGIAMHDLPEGLAVEPPASGLGFRYALMFCTMPEGMAAAGPGVSDGREADPFGKCATPDYRRSGAALGADHLSPGPISVVGLRRRSHALRDVRRSHSRCRGALGRWPQRHLGSRRGSDDQYSPQPDASLKRMAG